jgi:hypothetical protein
VQAFEIGKESARRSIQAAIGISPLPTSAQRRNEKSGVALQQIESAQQKGSYHFRDHYLDMIHHVGVMVEDLIDKIHDTTTDVAVRRQDETSATVRINDENDPEAISTKGDYLVTVSAGPSFESTRQAAETFLDTLAGIPNVFPLVAAELVRLKQLGPEGDRMAKILEMLKPPDVRAMLQAEKDGGQADPAALMQQLQAMQQQLQQAEGVMGQLKSEMDTEAAKQQATLEAAKLKAETDIELQRMRDATSIRVAEIAASSKGYLMEAQHAAAHEEQAGAQVHESEMADAGRQHEMQMAEQQRQAALEQQQAGGEQKMALQEQAGDQKMQQQEVAGEQQMTLAEQSAKLAAQQASTNTETE